MSEGIARQIVGSLEADRERSEAQRQEQVRATEQRLATIRTRMDQIYEDKLEGKVDEQFWARKQAEYRDQERKASVPAQHRGFSRQH